MLTDFLIATIAFLGLPLGVLLYFLAKEEYPPGKKYFLLLSRTSIIAIIIYLLFILLGNIELTEAILGTIITILSFYLTKKSKEAKITALSAALTIETLLIPSLIFIHNLANGTLISEKLKKYPYKSLAKLFIIFIVAFTILYFLKETLNLYLYYYTIGSLAYLLKE
tara:strand:+ start:313 stop:813 length:501 start_codon:yes stop_codon:yes gene_type:complete